MIAGYGPDVKRRLVTAFTRAVRSVTAAPLDGHDPSRWIEDPARREPSRKPCC